MFSFKSCGKNQKIAIVGDGLAGSLLAWHLIQLGHQVRIFTDNQPSASRVAAGIINPVTGQRFVLAEDTPEMLSYAETLYRNIENKLNIQCYFSLAMRRIFNSTIEKERCHKRLLDTRYQPFFASTLANQPLKAGEDSVLQIKTAWLDTNTLLDALHKFFIQKGMITNQSFSPDSSQPTPAQPIIYCEGYKMTTNPLFSWLPLLPAHGEIITCQSQQEMPSTMLNKNKWLLPISANTCRIGATYDAQIFKPTLQEISKTLLQQFTQDMLPNHQFKITQHQAGIRPATQDKQPFIGAHPTQQQQHIFNGFGSRGSLLIPWYANQFSQGILPDKANIKRYAHLCV